MLHVLTECEQATENQPTALVTRVTAYWQSQQSKLSWVLL